MTTERISEAQYLARERAATYRSEYLAGRMYAMSGGSRAHNVITLNLGSTLQAQLRGRPCEVYVLDMRVKVAPTGLYTYPDVVGLCGKPEFEDAAVDTLLNPAFAMEVLSPTTESYGRGEKFAHYRRVATMLEYVLVAQDRMRVERYARIEPGTDSWTFSALSEPGDLLELSTVACAVPLREIYERVTLPPPADVPLRG